MKKIKLGLLLTLLSSCLFGCGDNSKTIKVCASELPHADVLNNAVKNILKEKGYELKVSIIDWTTQNDAVSNKDYDANYFQHIPYLSTYKGEIELTATCKVHYEPLGIYRGKSKGDLLEGKSFIICNDTSNAIRAFKLLKNKGVLNTIPVDEKEENLTFTGSSWTDENSAITVTLIEESLLVASMSDYDFALLPCNTAFTGRITSDKQVAKEDDPEEVSAKANVLAVRKNDYLNDELYKTKIDLLTDALLSQEVSTYFKTKYLGAMTCDSSSQIDLRSSIK